MVGPSVDSKSAFLNNTPVIRSNFRCSGVRMCQYLHPDIRRQHHIDPIEALETIKEHRERNSHVDQRVRSNA